VKIRSNHESESDPGRAWKIPRRMFDGTRELDANSTTATRQDATTMMMTTSVTNAGRARAMPTKRVEVRPRERRPIGNAIVMRLLDRDGDTSER
jgi:hypothetical protein